MNAGQHPSEAPRQGSDGAEGRRTTNSQGATKAEMRSDFRESVLEAFESEHNPKPSEFEALTRRVNVACARFGLKVEVRQVRRRFHTLGHSNTDSACAEGNRVSQPRYPTPRGLFEVPDDYAPTILPRSRIVGSTATRTVENAVVRSVRSATIRQLEPWGVLVQRASVITAKFIKVKNEFLLNKIVQVDTHETPHPNTKIRNPYKTLKTKTQVHAETQDKRSTLGGSGWRYRSVPELRRYTCRQTNETEASRDTENRLIQTLSYVTVRLLDKWKMGFRRWAGIETTIKWANSTTVR